MSAGDILEMFVVFLFHFLPFHFCLNFSSLEGGKLKGALCAQTQCARARGACFLRGQGRPEAPTSSASLFSFRWNTVPATQTFLTASLCHPFFQRRDRVKYLPVST